jgi:hypothetical protein
MQFAHKQTIHLILTIICEYFIKQESRPCFLMPSLKNPKTVTSCLPLVMSVPEEIAKHWKPLKFKKANKLDFGRAPPIL